MENIFLLCLSYEYFGFHKILKSQNPDFFKRLQNKINLLNQLQQNGIWLLDTSIVPLDNRGQKLKVNDTNKILNLCWDNRISKLITLEQPEKLILIGKGVERALKNKLVDLSCPFYVQPQPQARLSSKELREVHQSYYDLVH